MCGIFFRNIDIINWKILTFEVRRIFFYQPCLTRPTNFFFLNIWPSRVTTGLTQHNIQGNLAYKANKLWTPLLSPTWVMKFMTWLFTIIFLITYIVKSFSNLAIDVLYIFGEFLHTYWQSALVNTINPVSSGQAGRYWMIFNYMHYSQPVQNLWRPSDLHDEKCSLWPPQNYRLDLVTNLGHVNKISHPRRRSWKTMQKIKSMFITKKNFKKTK